jgi:hypothetical protein
MVEVFTNEGKQIVGSKVETITLSELIDGYWHVTQIIKQSRLIEGDEDWDTKEVKMTASAEDLETAIANSYLSIETWLSKRGNDMFEEPTYSVPDKTDKGEYIN